MHNNLLSFRIAEYPEQFRQRIEEPVHNALFQRDDRVVGDRDVLGTDFGTALCDVAETYTELLSQIFNTIPYVQRMHLERGRIHQKSWADELFVHVMIAQDVADILAEIALDALSKLLDSFDVLLGNAPGPIRRVGLPRLELWDALFYPVTPGYVRDQVLHVRKCLHGFDGHRLIQRERVQPGHAHQFRYAINFRRARAAFPRLAVPSHREITGLFRLYLMHGIKDHHAAGNLCSVVPELPLAFFPAPDPKRGRRHYFISWMICCRSSRIGGIRSCVSCISPPAPFRTTMLKPSYCLSLAGKSSRKCAPRLSFRSSAVRVTISDTVSRLCRSSAVCQPVLYSRFPSTLTWSLAAFNSRMRSSACSISCSWRTIPTSSCITSCNACCTAYGLSEPLCSKGCSAHCSADPSSSLFTALSGFSFAKAAAYSPARLPKTNKSESEFPPSRLAPWRPAAHSPAANRPATSDIWESASTLTPPIM